MNNKSKFFIFGLVLLILVSVSAVSASENVTDSVSMDEDAVQDLSISNQDSHIMDDKIGLEENQSSYNIEENHETSFLTNDNQNGEITPVKIAAKSLSVVYSKNIIAYNFKVYNATDNKPLSGVEFYLDVYYDDAVYGYTEDPYEGVSDSNGNCVVYIRVSQPTVYYILINAYSPDDDGDNPFSKSVTLNVKSPLIIKAPQISVKYNDDKYFKIKLLKGSKPVKNFKLKVKIFTGDRYKLFTVKTDNKGLAYVPTKSLSWDVHDVVITSANNRYPVSKTSKIVVGKPSYVKGVTFKLRDSHHYFTSAKLKTGDTILAACNSQDGQFGRGIHIGTQISPGQEFHRNTKLIKAKIFLKNIYTGKIITKIQYPINNGFNIKPLKWIDDYTPFKAQVWYMKR